MNSFKKNVFIAQSRSSATLNMGWACQEKVSKCRKIFALCFSLIVVGLIIGGWTVGSYAADSASDAIKQEFKQRMGRDWYSATAKEQKIFIRSRELIKQRKAGKVNNQKKKYIRKSGEYEGVSLAVRYNFEKQGKGSWKNASKKDKMEFKTKYFEKKKQRRDQEADLAEQKRNQEESRREKFLAEKERLAERKQARIDRAQHKIEVIRERRERSRARMEAAKERIRDFRERSNDRR